MFNSSSRLGLGSIAKIEACVHCGEEFVVGNWDRTDGSGEYTEDPTGERAVREHVCKTCKNIEVEDIDFDWPEEQTEERFDPDK